MSVISPEVMCKVADDLQCTVDDFGVTVYICAAFLLVVGGGATTVLFYEEGQTRRDGCFSQRAFPWGGEDTFGLMNCQMRA